MFKIIFSLLIITSSLVTPAHSSSLGALKFTDSAYGSALINKPLSKITYAEISKNSKNDNVVFLLDKASNEGKIDFSETISYLQSFSKIPNGDKILLRCLQSENCSLQTAINISNLSELHGLIFIKFSPSSVSSANKHVGNITEGLMHRSFTRSGWQQLNGEIGVNGFDGLYVKRNKDGIIIDVLIAESKYNKSGLNDTNDGKQMSYNWTLSKIDKLIDKFPDNEDYKTIKNFITLGSYRSLLWNVKVEENSIILDVTRVHSKDGTLEIEALRGGEKINPTYEKNRNISISNPSNPYQQDLVEYFKSQLEI